MCIRKNGFKKFVGASTNLLMLVLISCGGGGSGAGRLVTEVSPSDGGTVSRDINQEIYPAGTNVTLTAEPAPWHKFKEWTGAVSGNTPTINIATVGNMKVTAVFEMIPHFTDSRDGKKYRVVDMPNGKTWMAENLNYETGNSLCYNHAERNCDTYGRLYDWNTATTVCPNGWRLPDVGDWLALTDDSKTMGTKLKSTNGWNTRSGTDEFGFSAMPGGMGVDGRRFLDVGSQGYWWLTGAPWPTTIRMNSNSENVVISNIDMEIWASVRCIKDD